MSLEQFVNTLACIAVILFGVFALLRPEAAANIAHFKLDDNTAVAETRINFGGLSLGMGAAPLLLNDPVAFQVVGIVFLAAFVTRLVTVVVDRPKVVIPFIISGLFELVVGLALTLR